VLTKEQMEERCGKLCASSIHKICKPKGLGDTGESYLWEVIAEKETGINNEIPANFDMQWGNEYEQEAGIYYSACKGIDIVKGESISIGELLATPDYLYFSENDSYGVEIKCPSKSYNHAKRLRYQSYEDIKKKNPEYYWQMVCGMLITGLRKWVFISYDPRFKDQSKKMVAITVPRIEKDIEFLTNRISESIKFMAENGVIELDHNHADFYKFLNETKK
jgi:hypothetical protein